MNILVDATNLEIFSGSRTAVFELYKELITLREDWNFILLVTRIENWLLKYPNVRLVFVPMKNRILQRMYIQYLVFKFEIVKSIDIVHFARSIGGITIRAKNIQTVFDITPIKLPHFYTRSTYLYWKYIAPILLGKADKIIVISKTVKEDILNYFKLPDNNVEVIYCAPKSIFISNVGMKLEDVKSLYNLPEQYILYTGLLARKKNLPTLIKALSIIKSSHTKIPPLVIVGSNYDRSDDFENILKTINIYGLEVGKDVIFIGPVKDIELKSLIENARFFVYPSLHEGFGIPCLESMICGTPVITTNSGAIPEIVGTAALVVENPTEASNFAEAIVRLLGDDNLRNLLIKEGKKRANNFNWKDSAKKMAGIFELLT